MTHYGAHHLGYPLYAESTSISMYKPKDPRELAIAILTRSRCAVQVGAVLADSHGIHSWGWNSAGPTGYGLCAERMALLRTNHKRLGGSTLFIAARRHKNYKTVTARPCLSCQNALKNVKRIVWRNRDNVWEQL